MSFSSFWKKLLPDPYPGIDNGLTSQSIQQPQLVCKWSVHAPQSGPSRLPFPRSGCTLTATATAAGELFLFGGQVHGCASSDLYVFSTQDFSATLLKTSGEVPTPRSGHGAALIGTTLLICGGTANFGDQDVLNHDSLYLINLVSRESTRVVVDGPGPSGRHCHTTTVVGSKLFVFGGQIGRKIVNDLWTLDLNCLKSQPLWESYEPTPGNGKPLPRAGHVSVATEGRIIIFGGTDDQHLYNDTWSFDISTREWTELQCTGSIPSPRTGHAAVLVDGFMYVFGGFTGKTDLNDLIALQLSTQRWFKLHNAGPSPRRRLNHVMASDGTRVFVFGGYSAGARSDKLSLIHVFDTKHIKYPDPEPKPVKPYKKTTKRVRKSSTVPPTQEQPQHPKTSSSEAHGASHLQNATNAISGSPVQITRKRNIPDGRPSELTGVNGKPRRVLEDDVSEGPTEIDAKFVAPHSSSKGEATRLELERQLSAVSLAAQTNPNQLISRLTDELALKSALLEQAEANATEAAKRAGLELREHADLLLMQTSLVERRDAELVNMQTKLDELLVSRDRQVGQYEMELASMRTKLEAKESELAVQLRLGLTDPGKGWTSLDGFIVPRDQQVGHYEKELTNLRAKLEAKESELEAVRLRLMDAERDLTRSKAEADKLRTQTATGSVNRDEDQVTRMLMERMRVIEVEMASRRWSEKSIEEMECRNEG